MTMTYKYGDRNNITCMDVRNPIISKCADL